MLRKKIGENSYYSVRGYIKASRDQDRNSKRLAEHFEHIRLLIYTLYHLMNAFVLVNYNLLKWKKRNVFMLSNKQESLKRILYITLHDWINSVYVFIAKRQTRVLKI
jgi:hypothetical protein